MAKSVSGTAVGSGANTSNSNIMKSPQPPAQDERAHGLTGSQSNAQRTLDLRPGHGVQNARLASSTAREEWLKLVDKVSHERRVLGIDRRRNTVELFALTEALDGLMKDADAIITMPTNAGDAQDCIYRLQSSSKRFRDLAANIKASWLDFQQKEQSLILLESRLQRKSNEVFERVHNPDEGVSSIGGGRPEDDDAESSSTGSQTHDGNTLVKEYYESLQEANYLREAIINYDARYIRRMTTRDRKQNAGQTITLSDSKFQQKYLQGRKSRLNDLIAAHRQMNLLWQQCVEQNLQVEKPSIPSIAEDGLLNQMSQTPQTILNYAASTSGNPDSVDFPGSLLVVDDAESRIPSWLDEVDSQSTDEELDAEEA